MQADRKATPRRPWMWVGFTIGAAVSFLAKFGIAGLLFLIQYFQVPEEELAIFTSLFYGLVFFIALGGMRTESRRHKLLLTGKPYATSPPELESRPKTHFDRIKTVLWYVFGCFSLAWLTPALIIFWAEPKHPDWAVSVCAYLFSFAAGAIYILKREEKIKTGYNYFILCVGICLGVILVDRITGILYP
jgi:hypothetical protein